MTRLRFLAAFALLLTLAACDSSDDDSVAGSYTASSFTNDGTDVLAAGGTLQMTLTDDGRVAGRLTVPESLAEGEETDFSLDGTYMQTGSTIRFAQTEDTFVPLVTWTYGGGELRGSYRSTSVVLTKR